MESSEAEAEDLFEIIPRIGVLRDTRFHGPLMEMLSQKDLKRREFAAYAMGSMGNREFLEPLRKAFQESQKLRGFGSREFQIAVIEAIGAIGDDAAVDFFLPILRGNEGVRGAGRIPHWIIESLGAIAQQGGVRSLNALMELARHRDPEVQAQAISELSVAYWHRPNEIEDSTLDLIYELTKDSNSTVAESALAALQSLADVGCRRAEKLFPSNDD
ncbi:MAG TPA: HEAT repeat domain-containing protein [Acidobacteriota bacterium]|nr:HEAT repeat domain-containing protein [Acidobacteriota bacterium]